MTITDKQVEAACHAQYGIDTWPLFKQWERESFRKKMRAALEAAEAARECIAPVYDSAMGEAAQRYIKSVGGSDAVLPQTFRWQGLWEAMIAAAPSSAAPARAQAGEAVAWQCVYSDGGDAGLFSREADAIKESAEYNPPLRIMPLYTTPPADARDGEDARLFRLLRDSHYNGTLSFRSDDWTYATTLYASPSATESLAQAIDRAMGDGT